MTRDEALALTKELGESSGKEKQKENRKYKDSVFTDLFHSDITAEENLRSLYNALHPEDPLTSTDIVIKSRLSNVFLNSIYNDIMGLFRSKVIVLGEHQSTINQNIPTRFLMYIGRVYEQMLDKFNKYGTKLIKIPAPEFYVFYNGKTEWDVKELRLSDAFEVENGMNQLELRVTLINIRPESGNDILKRCTVLEQYSKFVQAYETFKDSDDRMNDTINYCMEHDILTEYLSRKGKEVINMLTAEWDEVEAREIAREEGREEGREEEREKIIKNLYKNGVGINQIVKIIEIPLYQVENILRR